MPLPLGKTKLNRHEIANMSSLQPHGTPEGDVPVAEPELVPQATESAPERGRVASGSVPVANAGGPGVPVGVVPSPDAPAAASLPLGTPQLEDGQLRPAPALTTLPVVAPTAGLNPAYLSQATTTTSETLTPAASVLDPVSRQPATGAYRDLTSGTVVETDKEGNQVVPTAPPAGSPVMNQKDISMPGLEAAAHFLENPLLPSRSSTESDRGSQADGSHGREGTEGWNDGAHVTGFAVASAKRNADFHTTFPTVPEDDFLIENYACALSRDLLIQGRMYISEGHLCFYSNIFGWITTATIPFGEIVSIEKKNTAYLIPNAIQVKTLQNKYLFSSLVTRDVTYEMLVNIWRLAQPSASSQKHAALTENSAELADGKCKRQAKHASKREKLRKRLALARSNAKKEGEDTELQGAANDTPDSNDEADSDTSTDLDEEDEQPEGTVHSVTKCNCDKNKLHLANVVLDDTFDATPHQLFDLVFTSDFMQNFLADQQHLLDVTIGAWKHEDVGEKHVTAARDVSYVKPLNGPIGPKQTKCNIVEEQIHVDFNDFCTATTTTRTPDVPSGSSFAVKTRTCFTWAEHNHCKLHVTCAVEWTGRSMIKSIVDKASIDGQKQYYTDLGTALREQIKAHPDQFRNHSGAAATAKETTPATQKPVAPVEKQAETPPEAQPEAVPAKAPTWLDTVQDTVSNVAEMLNVRPTVLLLSGLVVMLLLSHLVLFFRTPKSAHTTALPAHRLDARAMRASSLVMHDEVQHALDALAHTRQLTAALESELTTLRGAMRDQIDRQREQLVDHAAT